jgi:hypothetical protein
MGQLNIRADDDLLEEVKRHARIAGLSANRWVVNVLGAAVDPALAGDEAAQIRERLARAGLLESPAEPAGLRPGAERLAEAGGRAARGTPLAQIVSEGRD